MRVWMQKKSFTLRTRAFCFVPIKLMLSDIMRFVRIDSEYDHWWVWFLRIRARYGSSSQTRRWEVEVLGFAFGLKALLRMEREDACVVNVQCWRHIGLINSDPSLSARTYRWTPGILKRDLARRSSMLNWALEKRKFSKRKWDSGTRTLRRAREVFNGLPFRFVWGIDLVFGDDYWKWGLLILKAVWYAD